MSDKKKFKLPRKFSKKGVKLKGYSMIASCAPYNDCFKFKQDRPFDVYIDQNPKDTIPIRYATIDDVRQTIKRLELLYKKMIIHQENKTSCCNYDD